MQGRRKDRIGALIQEYLAEALTSHARDPRIGFSTITHVEVTDDMKFAKVYFSVFGSHQEKSKTREALEQGRGFFQKGLARSLNLRYTPHLEFFLDESNEQGIKIDRIIKQIHEE